MDDFGSDRHTEPRRARIWLVDDSHLHCEMGRSVLADAHDVEVFDDGATMLEALSSGAAPDLLILDWHMPALSGLDVCRFVRQTRDPGILPILILTGTGGQDLAQAFSAGANDFVHKPFSEAELEARVGALLRNRHIHARLADAERRLRVEGEFRERFIAMLAHELRQPLNTVSLAHQAISATVPESAALARTLEMQARATGRMSRMIADLLDFARGRSRTGMPIERRHTDLESLTRAVVDEMRTGHPGRTFNLNVHGGCSGWCDHDRIVQVWTNLIANAVEHGAGPPAPIDVELVCHGKAVEFTVANQGEPITPQVLSTLFQPFHRGGDGRRAVPGLGLGLHIVELIVKAHGGTVSAESTANRTVFRVVLPLGSASSAESA